MKLIMLTGVVSIVLLGASNFIFAALEPSRSPDYFTYFVYKYPMRIKQVIVQNVCYVACNFE